MRACSPRWAGKKAAPAVPVLPTTCPTCTLRRAPRRGQARRLGKAADVSFSTGSTRKCVNRHDGSTDARRVDQILSGAAAIKGKKDLGKGLEGFFKAFSDQKWKPPVNALGNRRASRSSRQMTARRRGPRPAPGSKKEVKDWHWVDIMQPSADGKLQHGWGYANLLEVMQQRGRSRTRRKACRDNESGRPLKEGEHTMITMPHDRHGWPHPRSSSVPSPACAGRGSCRTRPRPGPPPRAEPCRPPPDDSRDSLGPPERRVLEPGGRAQRADQSPK